MSASAWPSSCVRRSGPGGRRRARADCGDSHSAGRAARRPVRAGLGGFGSQQVRRGGWLGAELRNPRAGRSRWCRIANEWSTVREPASGQPTSDESIRGKPNGEQSAGGRSTCYQPAAASAANANSSTASTTTSQQSSATSAQTPSSSTPNSSRRTRESNCLDRKPAHVAIPGDFAIR